MSYSNTKEAALKVLIFTANKHLCTPKEAIDEAKYHCEQMIQFHKDNAPKGIDGYIRYWTRYYTRVKQWLDNPNLTAF